MKRTSKPRASTARKRSAEAFKRNLEAHHFAIQHEARRVCDEWTLIRFDTRSSRHNIALHFADNGVRAYCLTPRDPRALKTKLESAGLQCTKVHNATPRILAALSKTVITEHREQITTSADFAATMLASGGGVYGQWGAIHERANGGFAVALRHRAGVIVFAIPSDSEASLRLAERLRANVSLLTPGSTQRRGL